ncbi:MAG: hypothetical protein D6785_06415, partial [Planctomycetota bacterium]
MKVIIQWLSQYFDLNTWTLFGLVAQSLFFSRFLVQWLATEKRKRSYMPKAFWYFSISGSILLMIYAVGRRDLVIALGQSLALVIYLRNLYLFEDMDKFILLEEEVERLKQKL